VNVHSMPTPSSAPMHVTGRTGSQHQMHRLPHAAICACAARKLGEVSKWNVLAPRWPSRRRTQPTARRKSRRLSKAPLMRSTNHMQPCKTDLAWR
jgi:hypothetical protein